MGMIRKHLALYNIFKRLPTDIPFSMGFFYSKEIKKVINEEISKNKFDLIFVHCSSVAQYVEDVSGVPKILDFGDMDSQKWLLFSMFKGYPLSRIYKIEGIRLQRAEIELAKKFDYCTCTTSGEMKTLNDYNTGARTDWFPNGVDSDYFKPTKVVYEPDTISFVGRMDYYPNQECMFDFCDNILPFIRAKRPNVKLMIIGAAPPRSVRRLEEIPGVTVTGTVADVRNYVQKCAVNIAPLNIARGTQNKILEAMAMGVPVVSSTCAAGGVDAVPGKHFLTAYTNKEFAKATISLLSDVKKRQQLGEEGRNRMLSHHNWENSLKRLDVIIEDCLRGMKT
jgi:sugar transferase (PEP-CTERM/EpsH1 system associated)